MLLWRCAIRQNWGCGRYKLTSGRYETPPQIASRSDQPTRCRLSHHDDVADFGAVKVAGMAGIIHKATEGVGFTDKLYADRRGRALGVGLLWGADHFLRPGSIAS
jgi:GH25 family lysozyme M1 (1,4-beta-N-acetylmuramidase)